MSFRKRSDVIGTPPAGRVPSAIGTARSPIGGARTPPPIVGARTLDRPIQHQQQQQQQQQQPLSSRRATVGPQVGATDDEAQILKHPGVRPSLITSYPTVSTGSLDLDKILLHQGMPLGTSLLVEESGTTDFALIILRVFASQGVVHNRVAAGKRTNSHVIVVGYGQQWATELPGLYKGTSKEQKQASIAEQKKKVSVSNLAEGGRRVPTAIGVGAGAGVGVEEVGDEGSSIGGKLATGGGDMKIAWRYGLNKKGESGQNDHSTEAAGAPAVSSDYRHQFDIIQRLLPLVSTQDVSFVAVPTDGQFQTLIKQIQSVIEQQLRLDRSRVVRLVIPNLLNPSMYAPQFSQPGVVVPLAHSLRGLLRQYLRNLVLACSLSLDLYAKDSPLTYALETLADAVVQLQPFNQEMAQLIERAYKKEPAKIQHGLVHICKVPHLSERGLMLVHNGEYAFRNGKKNFQIEEWGIPVEDDAEDLQTTKDVSF